MDEMFKNITFWISLLTSLLQTRCVQAGNVIGINIYRTDDAPYYFRGNKVLLAIACYNIALMVFTKFFYVSVNKYVPILPLYFRDATDLSQRKRETKWKAMSKEERQHYLETTNDKGNKRYTTIQTSRDYLLTLVQIGLPLCSLVTHRKAYDNLLVRLANGRKHWKQ